MGDMYLSGLHMGGLRTGGLRTGGLHMGGMRMGGRRTDCTECSAAAGLLLELVGISAKIPVRPQTDAPVFFGVSDVAE